MDELIKRLDEYMDTHIGVLDESETDSKWKNVRWLDCNDEEGKKLYTDLWDNLFIGSEWNYDNKAQFQKAGYSCIATDKDSFGILVAVIAKGDKAISLG